LTATDPNPQLWQGTSVVVTGGGGFLGSVLVTQLQALGADVRSVSSNEHDLRTAEGARAALTGAEVVFHLAARVGGIGFNLRNPAVLAHDNLLLGAQVFEQARVAEVGRLVAVSSVCAYPESPSLPFDEEELWSGYPEPSNAPYGIAKRVLGTLSESYARQYGFRSCTPILTNLYGPRDHDDPEDSHVIPALIRKFQGAQSEVVIWGTGQATRDFLYVDDAARALILAGERLTTLERPFAVNIGSGSERSIADVVDLIARLLDFHGEVRWDSDRPDGQARRRLDTTAARELLGFEPQVTLEEGLSRTVAAFEDSPNTL
jgi:GDP-L-fucose synthase